MKNKYKYILYIIIVSGIIGCSNTSLVTDVPADDFPNAICGIVKDTNNNPIFNTEIYIKPIDLLSDTQIASGVMPAPDAVTDIKGKYFIDSLPNGKYLLEASCDSLGAVFCCTLFTTKKTILTLPEIILKPFGEINGFVKSDINKPVYIRFYGLNRCFRIDSGNGEFNLQKIPYGIYSLQICSFVDSIPHVDIFNITIESGKRFFIDTLKLLTFDNEDYTTWKYSKTVKLITTKEGADVKDTVINFPVLLRLNNSIIDFSQYDINGKDLRFANKHGTHLRYEIEEWNAANQKAAIWVKVDTIFGNDTTNIFMYYGKTNCADFSNSKMVFAKEDGNLAVWHMNNTKDASNNSWELTTTSSKTMPQIYEGIIGSSMFFNGQNKFLAAPYSDKFSLNNNFSVCVWVKWTADTVPGFNRILSNKKNWNDPYGFELLTISKDSDAIDIRAQDSIGYGPQNVVNWQAHEWHFISLTWNSGICSIYIDGQFIASPFINAYDSKNDLAIGSTPLNNGFNWIGCIDEVRLTRNILSSSWIRLSYMNQKLNDALCRFE